MKRDFRIEIVPVAELETVEFLAIRQSVLEKRKRRRETHYWDPQSGDTLWVETYVWMEANN